MNSKLIVVVLAAVVSGCQVSVRLGSDGTFVPHSHEPIASSAPAAAEVATKSDADNAPVCPSVPAVAECPAAEPVVKAASDTQTSAAAVSPPEANTVASESHNAQPQETQSQDSQQQEQTSEQQAQSMTNRVLLQKPSTLKNMWSSRLRAYNNVLAVRLKKKRVRHHLRCLTNRRRSNPSRWSNKLNRLNWPLIVNRLLVNPAYSELIESVQHRFELTFPLICRAESVQKLSI